MRAEVSRIKPCCAFGMLMPLSRMNTWNLSTMEEEDITRWLPIPAAQAYGGGHWPPSSPRSRGGFPQTPLQSGGGQGQNLLQLLPRAQTEIQWGASVFIIALVRRGATGGRALKGAGELSSPPPSPSPGGTTPGAGAGAGGQRI